MLLHQCIYHDLFVYCLFRLCNQKNGAQFLNTTSSSLLFEFAAGGGGDADATDIVPLTSIYASL